MEHDASPGPSTRRLITLAGGGSARGSTLGAQAASNAAVWAAGEYVRHYDHHSIAPPEAVILARYREAVTGRVLDAGCGAGRLLGYLVLLGGDVHGFDLSEAMVQRCRRRFPETDVHVGDLREPHRSESGPYDAILIADNVIDVFDDTERREILADLRSLLAPGGLLIFSSHNLDSWDGPPRSARIAQLARYARDVAKEVDGSRVRAVLAPLSHRSNRRRLAPLQYRRDDHAIVNDAAHHWSLLHYYIGRGGQERQLAELGFTVVDVLQDDGTTVAAGQAGRGPWLYYVARASDPAPPGP